MAYQGVSSIVRFEFVQANAAASQAAVEITTHDTGVKYGVFPFGAGAIVGISVACENARTAGTCTVDATIDGAVTGLQAVLDATNTQYHYNTQDPVQDAVVKGKRIGVKITTDAGWAAGTTPSVVVSVFVQIGQSQT